MKKKVVYVDLDGVMVDLEGYIRRKYTKAHIDEIGLGKIIDEDQFAFYLAEPIPGAIKGFQQLALDPRYDVYILSTAPWENIEAWKAKRVWVEEHLGDLGKKRLILTHHKNLLRGDFLIDDRYKNGVTEFKGIHINFGEESFKTWDDVLDYLTK